jgi:hypothetical protein
MEPRAPPWPAVDRRAEPPDAPWALSAGQGMVRFAPDGPICPARRRRADAPQNSANERPKGRRRGAGRLQWDTGGYGAAP